MKNEKNENMPYNIGLDIGTTSVGWAVVDDNFNIMKKKNKKIPLWGVRLFDAADPAEKRRMYRSTRRRYKRRRERIKLLQEIFKPEIDKVDPDFFNKLNTSNISNEDKNNQKYNLNDFDKKEIFSNLNKYPTIYHLRKDLIESDEKKDIRLIYLAMHHMIKYRGNFNYGEASFNPENIDINSKINDLLETFLEFEEDSCKYDKIENDMVKSISKILKTTSKSDKNKLLKQELKKYFLEDVANQLTKALAGNQIEIEKLLGIEIDDNDNDKNKIKKIYINDSEIDENIIKLSEKIEEKVGIIVKIKELYDAILLNKLLKGGKSISNLMVNYYETYKKDLSELKKILKTYKQQNKNFDGYENLFKNKICLYERNEKNISNCKYNDFIKEVEKILYKIKNDTTKQNIDDKVIENILLRIENEEYMPRITSTDNRIFPYQINKYEIETIINNQGTADKYPFLAETLEDGTYKITKLLTFKIPYYVGPLVDDENHPFAWMKRKSNEKITPFNFEQVVDVNESAKRFIEKMIGNCTYLINEKRMPNNSILYSKFKVLQELKQIKICDKNITDINKIYNEFFLNENIDNKYTDKDFKNYLRINSEFSMYDNITVTGYSGVGKFANNMQSYLDFFGKNGVFKNTKYEINNEENELIAENIIKLITIFEDKEILKNEILDLYPELSCKIEQILSLKYSGWGNLSKAFITTEYYLDPHDGNNRKSIMNLLETTDENFMQIYSNPKYNFKRMVKEINFKDKNITFDYSLVENLTTSPANKRGIYETLKIIREIVDYMGYAPKFISLEMARGKDGSGIKESKKKKLIDLYKKNKDSIDDYETLYKELENTEITKTEFQLYFLQEGKCMYTGESLGGIKNSKEWEIDHILPRALVKDDSIENKVLVCSKTNGRKIDDDVVPKKYRNQNNIRWWKHLKDIGMMTEKKYNNLVRNEFSDHDIEGFIQRQLVETRQIIQHVADIIKKMYDKTEVLYINSSISSNYRQKFSLYKYRNLNDYHHAHDAYLAVVLGIYQKVYMKNIYSKEEYNKLTYELSKKFNLNQLKYGYLINSIDQNFMLNDKISEKVFNIGDFVSKIENTLYRNDILISKKAEIKTGKFYDETKNKKGKKGVPLKKEFNDIDLYGSYTGLNPSHAILCKYIKKNEKQQRLIGIPIYIEVQNNKDILLNYIKDLLKLDSTNDIEILKDKIPFYTLINWDNQICSLVGATDTVELCNAKQFKIEKQKQIIWKNSLNRLFNNRKKGIEDLLYDNQLTDIINYVLNKIEKEYVLYNNLIPELRGYLNDESIKNLSFEDKEKTLKELFNLLKCNSKRANLKFLNSKASSDFGRKNNRIISNATIIYKSPTGLKEKKYEF